MYRFMVIAGPSELFWWTLGVILPGPLLSIWVIRPCKSTTTIRTGGILAEISTLPSVEPFGSAATEPVAQNGVAMVAISNTQLAIKPRKRPYLYDIRLHTII